MVKDFCALINGSYLLKLLFAFLSKTYLYNCTLFNLYCIGLHGLKMDHFVKWLTGSKSIPPLGCNEGCRCRPTTSACDIVLKLPVHITSAEDMGLMIESVVKESVGFGLI